MKDGRKKKHSECKRKTSSSKCMEVAIFIKCSGNNIQVTVSGAQEKRRMKKVGQVTITEGIK